LSRVDGGSVDLLPSKTTRGTDRERDDDYAGLVARLNDRWRVISCRDGIQWILQRRDAKTPHTGVWRGAGYFRTRNALIAACVALVRPLEPSARASLERLPERHP
jgi:hypothetical protein